MKKTILNLQKTATGYKYSNKTKVISREINASIDEGKLVALLGPNGCGKSTLLRTIAGLQPSLEGTIFINNTKIENLKGKAKAKLLSLVLTDRIEVANLIVRDIVEVGRYPYTGSMGVLQPKDEILINEAIQQCNLEDYSDRMYSELSDGEKQRVMLARALAQDTPLMMLDEPTAHLDLPNRVELMKMLRDLAQEMNKAILLSTHELDLALQWCDTIWLMNTDGYIESGFPEDLVLNDAFAKVFSNDSFYFDKTTGVFKLNRRTYGTVFLTGNNVIKEWTRRALEREGYELIDNEKDATHCVHIQDSKKWLLKNQNKKISCSSIEELLNRINNLNNNVK
ncbi:iron complex transport system ATP-binding protein [Balneicella halophila]|uniref:Iron complex transport system ATP-binding protein n=1 Tax=Balneicella halophila TaxID=1537566 RepID=A0A7L4UMZ5_BALHA|nr:ABC transporter ATP-binding protein [Balneicella halophila]PVX50001.1 iron complex transport system ATP-binding protein [Balneicella halophila]